MRTMKVNVVLVRQHRLPVAKPVADVLVAHRHAHGGRHEARERFIDSALFCRGTARRGYENERRIVGKEFCEWRKHRQQKPETIPYFHFMSLQQSSRRFFDGSRVHELERIPDISCHYDVTARSEPI